MTADCRNPACRNTFEKPKGSKQVYCCRQCNLDHWNARLRTRNP